MAYSIKMPDMSRNEDLAGRTVYSNGMNVTYNDQGYAVSAVNPNHANYAGTTMSAHAQDKDAALRGETWTPPDTSGLSDWNGGDNDTGRRPRSTDGYASAYDGAGTGWPSAYDAQRAANDAAVEQAVFDLSAQREKADRGYDDYARQAYRDKMDAQRDIGQYLGARGVTGGAAESTLLGLNTAYADELRRIEQSRRETLGEFDRAISQARLTGGINNAKAAAQEAKERAALYAQEAKERKAERERQEQYERAERSQREQEERAAEKERRSWARTLAGRMLAQGRMPDDETLALAGITRAQAEALLPEKEEPAYVPVFSSAQAYDAAKRGRLTGQMLRDWNYYQYGDPDYGAR